MCNKKDCSSSWCDNDRCTSCIDVYKYMNSKVYNYVPWNKYMSANYDNKEEFNDEYYCKYDYEKDFLDLFDVDYTLLDSTSSEEILDNDDYYYDDYVDDSYDIMYSSSKFMYT